MAPALQRPAADLDTVVSKGAPALTVPVDVPAGTKVVIRTVNTATAGAAADLGITLSFQRLLSTLLSEEV